MTNNTNRTATARRPTVTQYPLSGRELCEAVAWCGARTVEQLDRALGRLLTLDEAARASRIL